MPLAVDVEHGINRDAKTTCHLLCMIFHFTFQLWARQEPMKHEDILPSLIAKPPSAWGDSQGCLQPPNSYRVHFVQL